MPRPRFVSTARRPFGIRQTLMGAAIRACDLPSLLASLCQRRRSLDIATSRPAGRRSPGQRLPAAVLAHAVHGRRRGDRRPRLRVPGLGVPSAIWACRAFLEMRAFCSRCPAPRPAASRTFSPPWSGSCGRCCRAFSLAFADADPEMNRIVSEYELRFA